MSGGVYLLWFLPQGKDNDENGLLIGVYTSEASATAAIDRLKSKPGFVDYPQGFQIHGRELDQDSWTEGFIFD